MTLPHVKFDKSFTRDMTLISDTYANNSTNMTPSSAPSSYYLVDKTIGWLLSPETFADTTTDDSEPDFKTVPKFTDEWTGHKVDNKLLSLLLNMLLSLLVEHEPYCYDSHYISFWCRFVLSG